MSQNMSFSPEMMAKLASKQQFIEVAAKAVSDFASFPGPDGRYYALFNKILGRFDPKDGSFIVTFAFTSLALVETGDQAHAGFPLRIQFYTRASAKQTEQEAWNRLYTDGYQAMGIATAAWTNVLIDMPKATEFLNTEKFPVVLTVTANKNDSRFRNIRISEVLNHESIKMFTKPKVTITDDELQQEAPELLDESLDSFPARFKEAESFLNDMERTALIQQATSSGVEIENVAAMSDAQLKTALLRHLVISANRDPAEFGLEETPFDSGVDLASGSDKTVITEVRNGEIIGEILEEALIEEGILEEEDDEPVFPSWEDQLKGAIAHLPRENAKLACTKYGIIKFSKSMTDDVIRGMLYDAALPTKEIRW